MMKKLLTLCLLLTFCFSSFADVIPKFGFSSIITKRDSGAIGYQYCLPTEGCIQIGNQEFYSIEVLEKQAKTEKGQVILSWALIPILAIGGAIAGGNIEALIATIFAKSSSVGAVIPAGGFLLGFFGGGIGTFFVGKNQRIQAKVLMIDQEKSEIIVKDDKAVEKYKKMLKKVLDKI